VIPPGVGLARKTVNSRCWTGHIVAEITVRRKAASFHRNLSGGRESGPSFLYRPRHSTGSFGYPVPQAVAVALSSTVEASLGKPVDKVRFRSSSM